MTLNTLDWNNPSVCFRGVERLLSQINIQRNEVRHYFNSLAYSELQRRVELSHETATHYKWFVFKEPDFRYEIWLHEYKSSGLRRKGYAEVPHNHRYWFSSLILHGGFNHNLFEVIPPNYEDIIDSIRLTGVRRLSEGAIYTIDPDEVHSVGNIAEPTLTLIIRSKALKLHSESFDEETNQVTRYVPFSSRIKDFSQITRLI